MRNSIRDHRRHIEIGDRAKLLLAHDRKRHENRGEQREHQSHGSRHLSVDTVERLIVPEADLDIGERLLLGRSRY